MTNMDKELSDQIRAELAAKDSEIDRLRGENEQLRESNRCWKDLVRIEGDKKVEARGWAEKLKTDNLYLHKRLEAKDHALKAYQDQIGDHASVIYKLREDIQKLEAENAKFQDDSELAGLRADLHTTEQHAVNQSQALREQRAAIDNLQSELSALKLREQDIREDAKNRLRHITTLKAKNSKLKSDNEDLLTDLEEKDERITDLRKQVEVLEQDLGRYLMGTGFSEEVEHAQHTADLWQVRCQTANRRIRELEKQLEGANGACAAYARQWEEASARAEKAGKPSSINTHLTDRLVTRNTYIDTMAARLTEIVGAANVLDYALVEEQSPDRLTTRWWFEHKRITATRAH
jgi:chromosome segregation ATPase